MLKIIVLLATVAICTSKDASAPKGAKPPAGPPAQAGPPPPTPDPKMCNSNYLKETKFCGNVPRLIDEEQFKQCGKKPEGKDNNEMGSTEGGEIKSTTKEAGNKVDSKNVDGSKSKNATGENKAKPAPPQKPGKPSRGRRAPKDDMKKPGGPGEKGPGPGPGCAICKMECIFNSSGMIDGSNNVDIAAVKSQFVAKAPADSAWVDLISTAVDSCWTDAQNAPAPTPPPGAPAPPADKAQCKHNALYLVQCVQRNLIINTPAAEKTNNTAECDARVEHLKNCDPMMPAAPVEFDRAEKVKDEKDNKKKGGKVTGDAKKSTTAAPKKSKDGKAKAGKKSAALKKTKKTSNNNA